MNRLKDLRKQRGLTQVEFARQICAGQSTVANWENGVRDIDSDRLVMLADYFEVPIDYLLGRSDSHVKKNAKGVRVPVLGSIPAGIPIEAIEDVLDHEEIPAEWTTGGREYFALKIQGRSMSPKYLENDIVIFQKLPDCDSGAECAVIVNGDDATFKKVIKQTSGIILQPLNITEFEPVFYSNEDIESLPVSIIGIAEEIRRKA